MGESHSLFRIVLFLGFVLLISSVLATPWVYVGQPLPSNSPWGQFSNGIQNFPQFSNPFNAGVQSSVSHLHSVESAIPWNAPATGCNPDHYAVSCLQSIDNATYIRLQFVNAGNSCTANVSCGTAEVYMQGGAPTHFTLTDFTVTVYCRATTSAPAKWAMFFRTFSDVTVHTCPQSTIFQPVSFSFPLSGDKEPSAPACFWSDIFTYRAYNSAGCVVDTDLTHHPGIQADIEVCGITAICPASDGNSGPFEITAIIVDATFTVPQASCGTFDVGCVVARFFDPVIKGLQWVLNGIVFVFQIIAWFVGMIGLFFGALLSILSIPGAPPLITGLIGIIVIGCLFFISIVIMGKIRGTGNVG